MEICQTEIRWFSRPNSDVQLESLFENDPKDPDGPLTADEWIAQRVRLRRTANFKGAKTFDASRGTEHLKGRSDATSNNKSALDRPKAVVEPV